MTSTISLRIRLHLGEDIAIGPGKVDLLEAIQRSGSISGAARELGMSYRRAWLLVETMNRCFREPLVISLVGGRHGGGARLSDAGEQVLRQFRSIVRISVNVTAHFANNVTGGFTRLRGV